MGWGIGGDLDDDLDDDDEAGLNENKIVAVLLSIMAVSFIAFVIAVPHIDRDGNLRKTLSGMGHFGRFVAGAGVRTGMGGGAGGGESSPIKPDGLGPITIGMTAEEVRKLGPANFYRGAGGRLVANVRSRNAAYTAWFSSGEQSGAVTRLRYDRIFPGDTVEEAIEFFTKGVGAPDYSKCTGAAPAAESGVVGVRECALRWKLHEGVSIKAQLRQDPSSGGARTTASVTAAGK